MKGLKQYFTNGIEILEEADQPGDLIPIIPMIGLERWVDEGSGPKRKINSLIRLARDPQLTLAYLSSQQMEEAGLTPRVPFLGYKGQFESDQEAWETVTKVPHAYLQADPMVDGATGQVLPLPQRPQFTPNFQEYEIAKDSARRAIQAAMGISPLPTAAQRNNEKSGVALEKIQDAQNLGSYHFIDSFDRALCYAGRVILKWIPVTYDTEREVALRKADGTHKVVTINTPEPYFDEKSQAMEHFDTSQGDHYPDISTGPSHQSQMEDAAEFLDQLISNMGNLPVAPPQAAKLLSLAIKMRNLGPLGDQMAEIVSPKDQTGQQAMQLAQQAQAMQEAIQKLSAELQQLKIERAGKVLDNQARMNIERMKIEAGLAEAEITAKAQIASERQEFVSDMWNQVHDQAHEAGMQAEQHAHEQALASQQAVQQQQQQQAAERAATTRQQADQQHEISLAGQQQQFEQQQTGQQQQHEIGMAQRQAKQINLKPKPKQ